MLIANNSQLRHLCAAITTSRRKGIAALVPSKPTLLVFSMHRSALLNYARGITGSHAQAEDVVQEAWLRFDAAAKRRLLEEPLGFLYRIVRNIALDQRRAMGREGRLLKASDAETAMLTAPAETPSPEVELASREELRLVAEAMAELPQKVRAALEMHRLGGLKLREIAERLDVSVTTAHELVAAGVNHCRQRLRDR